MDTGEHGFRVGPVEYHSETDSVRRQFNQAHTPASTAVVETLAGLKGVDPVDIDPLHSILDPDVLDALVHVRNGMNGDIHVSFTHGDHTITVSSYGVVTVRTGHEPTAEPSARGWEDDR